VKENLSNRATNTAVKPRYAIALALEPRPQSDSRRQESGMKFIAKLFGEMFFMGLACRELGAVFLLSGWSG
jgi:hypothetical protein